MKAYLVGTHQINEAWSTVEPLITAACEYNNNRYKSEDYLKALIAGHKQLWVAISGGLKGIAITYIDDFPQKRCCIIDIFTGDGLEELLEYLPVIEAWAKENRCVQMLAATRIGLSRKLKSHNYRTTHALLEKDI